MMNRPKQTRDTSKESLTQDGQTNCGECNEASIRKNLPRHFERNHPGVRPYEKGPSGTPTLRELLVIDI